MSDGKLCGNCAGDHKFLDCPFIERQITKIEYEQFLKNQEIVERIKELNLKLILQHIRDSFSEDRELMSVEAQTKTVKCIEDLMELQKILVI